MNEIVEHRLVGRERDRCMIKDLEEFIVAPMLLSDDYLIDIGKYTANKSSLIDTRYAAFRICRCVSAFFFGYRGRYSGSFRDYILNVSIDENDQLIEYNIVKNNTKILDLFGDVDG